jgi:hypothetical protein
MSTGIGTVYWDCNGQGCDSNTLDPWNEEKYVSAAQYAPVHPKKDLGIDSPYDLWMTGAFSNTLSQQLGADDPCCGQPSDDPSGGCGKCVAVQIKPSQASQPWKVLVMKKNQCPPEASGCEQGKIHIDFAVPGHDDLNYSLAQKCGQPGTFLTAQDEGRCIQNDDLVPQCSCDFTFLPSATEEEKTWMTRGCQNFVEWGWKQGDPTFTYEVVDCPQEYKDYIGNAFGKNGPVPPSSEGYTPAPTLAPVAAPKDHAALAWYWIVLVVLGILLFLVLLTLVILLKKEH